jgi:hypothetical protein
MKEYSFLVFVAYMMIIVRIIPKSAFEFDLHKINFNLLPYRTRFVSVGIGVVAPILYMINIHEEKALEVLISFIHLALFIFLFSKQKNEDEFSENVRLKSFTYSFVSFAGLIGMFSVLDIHNAGTKPILDSLMLGVLLALSFLMSLLYFFITLYKLKREKN